MGAPSEIPPDALLGGKIRLIKRIGRGGMGDVWVARNEATQAEVAVKTLQRSERTTVHDERFRREARLAATISHRNVVRIFDLVDDEEDGTLGLVMELLRGGTLEGCMRDRGNLSTVEAIAVAAPILSALHHVHQKGIIHRDVKPANVFFAVEPDGHVIPKILDFGIAKLPAAGSALTVDGSVLGTPHYMSPEQIRGQEDIDGRSDMFSLAIVLYEMLTGTRVFQRDSAAASLAAVLEHEVDPDPRIEPKVWIALSRALAKRPYERFASCAEFADALRNAVEASEEDLAHCLQELRPRNHELPDDSAAGSGAAVVSSSSSRGRSSSRSRAKRPIGLMVGIAGAVAVLAVTATLAVTRQGQTARASNNTAATAPPVNPPATSIAAASASATSLDFDMDNGTAAAAASAPAGTASSPTPPNHTRASVPQGNGGRPWRPPSSPSTKSTKPTSTKPVATTLD